MEAIVLENLRDARLVNKFPAFFEYEGSLSCSQEPTTGHYSEAAEYVQTLPSTPKSPIYCYLLKSDN
jgi:hypothetical protein